MTLTGSEPHDVSSTDIGLSHNVATIYSPSSSPVTQNPPLVCISLLPGASCQHDLRVFAFFLHHDLWLTDVPGPQIPPDQQFLATLWTIFSQIVILLGSCQSLHVEWNDRSDETCLSLMSSLSFSMGNSHCFQKRTISPLHFPIRSWP